MLGCFCCNRPRGGSVNSIIVTFSLPRRAEQVPAPRESSQAKETKMLASVGLVRVHYSGKPLGIQAGLDSVPTAGICCCKGGS